MLTGVLGGDPDDADTVDGRGPVHARPIGATSSLCGEVVIPLAASWYDPGLPLRCGTCIQLGEPDLGAGVGRNPREI